MRHHRSGGVVASSPAAVLDGFLKAAIGLSILVVARLALFVAWWIALLFAGVLWLYRGEHRHATTRATATIIDGEFRGRRSPPLEAR